MEDPNVNPHKNWGREGDGSITSNLKKNHQIYMFLLVVLGLQTFEGSSMYTAGLGQFTTFHIVFPIFQSGPRIA